MPRTPIRVASFAVVAMATTVEARPSFIGVGGFRQDVSVLHADIRGYTTVAEALPPEAVAETLLRYHGAAVGALLSEGATLDRFIGDEPGTGLGPSGVEIGLAS